MNSMTRPYLILVVSFFLVGLQYSFSQNKMIHLSNVNDHFSNVFVPETIIQNTGTFSHNLVVD